MEARREEESIVMKVAKGQRRRLQDRTKLL